VHIKIYTFLFAFKYELLNSVKYSAVTNMHKEWGKHTDFIRNYVLFLAIKIARLVKIL